MIAESTVAEPARAASLFDSGRNCFLFTRAARAAFAVDAEAYYHAFAQAAERARESIIIIGWDFDSRTRLTLREERGVPALLGEFLNYLVKRRGGLKVYILSWDYPMIFGEDREVQPLYGQEWKPRRRVQLHYDSTQPVGASHHQKIVVIDDALAFCGGLDLTCRRWDTCAHNAHDGAAYAPVHDVMTAVDGEAARVLAQLARKRWMLATGEVIPAATGHSDPWPYALEVAMSDVDVAISRTLPKSETGHEVREVETLYLDMIAAAKRYLYIENQYFTSESIGAALAARLQEPDPPEVVLVTTLLSHGWLEEPTMRALRARLVRQLRAADTHSRFEAYYAHVPGLAEGTCLDCYSKLMIVDDEWVRVGSANLTNRSMQLDSECDLTFEARGKPRIAAAMGEFRNRLLAEHLGTGSDEVRDAVERYGSVHAALRELRTDGRGLQILEDLHLPDVAVDFATAEPEPPVALEQLIEQFAPSTAEPPAGPAWAKIAAIALLFAGLAAAWRYTPLSAFVTAESIIDWAQGVGSVPWAPLVVMLAYTPACFVMFPRPLITLFAVIAFGPFVGFAYSIMGILGAALATYFAGRALPRDSVRRLAGDKLNEMSEVLRRRGLLAVFAMRIVPVAPFAVEGIVAGAVRIKLWHFALGTVLGMAPGTLTTSVFGDQIQTALADPSRINYWLIAGVVVLFAVLIYFVRRWFVKEHRLSVNAAAAPQNQPA